MRARSAAFLDLTEPDFIARFTRLNTIRSGLTLADQPDGSRAFLDGNDCRINPVKPQQCRDFPNLWNFPGFEKTCQAKPHDVSAAEWKRRVLETTRREVSPQ